VKLKLLGFASFPKKVLDQEKKRFCGCQQIRPVKVFVRPIVLVVNDLKSNLWPLFVPNSEIVQPCSTLKRMSSFNDEFQNDGPKDHCGVFGIYAPGLDVARMTFFSLVALQHRGQVRDLPFYSNSTSITNECRKVVELPRGI
jgi:hypothetical protein